ncbi:hypothetical protein [Conexibacter sp. SYSU D00693]|uniref:hypothetical protein n=1 Tax=Conexibacter sp. SYSU D00693 TaxID=2812560 RepID=UPI00196B7708|nr:hypothetical protein [Conexibacter sp. SYSU D00693]
MSAAGALRYLVLVAARTRTPLPAVAATLFALLGVYAYRHNEPGATWGLTALVACALAAWLVGAVLDGEPAAQADMATAALGGRPARTALDAVLVGGVAVALSALFLAYPPALGLLDPEPTAGLAVAALLAHLAAALVGGALAVLCAPPRVTRRASAVAAVLGGLLLLVVLAEALGPAGGPVALARTLTDADDAGVDWAATAAGLAGCAVLALALLVAATRWARRAG